MSHTAKEIMSLAQSFASAWSIVGSRFDDGSGIENAENLKTELRQLVEAQAAEIAALRAEVERLKAAAVPAPSQSADAEDAAIRGAHINGNMFHDAGAYAQCGHCGRYSDDPRSLKLDIFLCDCGMSHGWSGSFKRPTKESKWSDAAIDAARGGES